MERLSAFLYFGVKTHWNANIAEMIAPSQRESEVSFIGC